MAKYELNNPEINIMVKEAIEEKSKKFNLQRLDPTEIQCIRVKGKKSKAYADVRKIRYPTNLFTVKKWLISFYDIFDDLPKDKQKIVVIHELLHIDAESEKLLKHDIEDFRAILENYGINWQNEKN